MDYEVLSSNVMYKGPIFTVHSDFVKMPDGNSALREYVERGAAAAVVPIDNDGNIIFVSQYRHPLHSILLEIPAGMMEDGEHPKSCALRELEEETGFICHNISSLISFYPSVGICQEELHIFLARDLTIGKRNLDPDEFISVSKLSLDKALKMVFSGEIKDSKTIIGLLCAQHALLQ